MAAYKIDGKKRAQEILTEVADVIKKRKAAPKLVIIQANNDQASAQYVRMKQKRAREIGIDVEIINFPEHGSQQELVSLIHTQNNNLDTHGILLQLPLHPHLDKNESTIINEIDPTKDVDGLTATQQGACMHGIPGSILPATVEAVWEAIRRYDTSLPSWQEAEQIHIRKPLQGKHAVILNDTYLIGKPLGLLFSLAGATLSILNEWSSDSKTFTRHADYLVSATGRGKLLTADAIKSGAVCIDVTNAFLQEELTGDFIISEDFLKKAAAYTPVPGGIGPLTIACLLRNIAKVI